MLCLSTNGILMMIFLSMTGHKARTTVLLGVMLHRFILLLSGLLLSIFPKFIIIIILILLKNSTCLQDGVTEDKFVA